jgi:dephospho-CoA kinase
MLKVGLTGGYATGKSFVASELERLGCYLIYADRLGHRVLEPTGEAYGPTVDAFGPDILTPEGFIDRKKLGALVFASPELLKVLSGFVHPAVFRLEERELAAWNADHPNGIAVIEAAILIETGRYRVFDRLIVTACSEDTQIARGMRRDAITREAALARIGHQLPLEEKKKYAHYIIDTEGTKEQTAQQVKDVFNDLQRLAEAGTP